MASPPVPPLLEHLARRPFAFYPAIRNVEHNQWFFRKATWSELVVVNNKTGAELSIPRRFVGEVSSIDDPVLIVGLQRELEHRDGAVWPFRRRVIEMPLAVGADTPPDSVRAAAPPAHRSGPAPVVGIRLETRRGGRTLKLVGGAIAAALLVGGVSLVPIKGRSVFELTAKDGHDSVVRKLGAPLNERSVTQDGVEYRALGYVDRRFSVILRGGPGNGRYVGAMDANWIPVHSVMLPSGESSLGLLRGLKRF